ncbi:hypothetical protein [Dyella sp. GSA-30]|uniref:hypothetical protein n=1 Tax=Dyella sp. GSA-30 TaxID=2994496 RepID=UPI002493904C|nr:hypothetical protein [Dyella sp. GSA-30]BDU18600.1 hypothetical protein DYGSA30_00570 [Dyella sp. GSA-30]
MNGTTTTVFKFKGEVPALVVVVGMVMLCVSLAILIAIQERSVGGVLFCLGLALFFVLLGRVFLYAKLDVQLDNESISRILLGRKVQVIRWEDVERVVVFPVYVAGVKDKIDGYNINAKTSNDSRTRKIYFNNQKNDLTDLLAVLNVYIERNQIRVERVSGGVTTVCKSV